MATVSGRILFDSTRTAAPPTGMTGIANVPVVLQNIATNYMVVGITDATGNYSFINVPNGSFHIIEAYDAFGGTNPADFNLAVLGDVVEASVPPISYVTNPPVDATNLDCTTRNTLPITVTGADIVNQYICNGPVRYSNMQIDPCVVVDWGTNVINDANKGDFGSFPAGTPVMTGANPNPYPNVNPDFGYVQPANGSPNPADGFFTIQNIATGITYQQNNVWWRIADKTTGNETGRMMLVNGSNPAAIFFHDIVFIKPYTYYLFATWILNLIKVTGRVDPELGVRIIAPDGVVLYDGSIGVTIPVNQNEPEWHQTGTLIYTDKYSTLEVQFVSLGSAASGNDYAIDNVGLYEAELQLSAPVKSANPAAITLGDTTTITVSLTNECHMPMTNIVFNDVLLDGLEFIPGTVTIDGMSCPSCDPNVGFPLADLVDGDTVEVTFDVISTYVPWRNIAINTAAITYELLLIDEANPIAFKVDSEPIEIIITPPYCPILSVALQREDNVQSEIEDIVPFNTPLFSKGAITYRPDGSIDIAQQGSYIVAWFVSAKFGLATNGQLYTLKKYDHDASEWTELANASNHIKDTTTIGFSVVNVTSEDISENAKATIAVFNNADESIELAALSQRAGVMVYGGSYDCVDVRLNTIDTYLTEILENIQIVESFVYMSDVTTIMSETPEFLGLGVSIINLGYKYNFWGIGALDDDDTLVAGNAYYLITGEQFPPLANFIGDPTIGILWIEDLDERLFKYPLHYDGNGIYFTPNMTMNLVAGTKFSFMQMLILIEPTP